ncbi:GTP-binding protein [Dehalobacter sp. TBBPA1]|uniref:GTP-binding protein n=1 Tax=Dehalobacter sp. TBBPA1 TaxID=3235037 RepID=UPI0034A2ED48
MAIKVIIVSGFLGSGKTSVLMQLAIYLIEISHGNKNEKKVVIIENEIGTAGIDNLLLENVDFTVKNLFAGCACCTSSAKLTDTVDYLSKEYSPEWIIIEATGLAFPSKIKSALETELGMQAMTIIVVDAKRWFRLVGAMENFVSEQLKDTKSVLVNKIDLVGETTVEKVQEGIRKYNRDAYCYPVSATNELSAGFWDDLFEKAGILNGTRTP